MCAGGWQGTHCDLGDAFIYRTHIWQTRCVYHILTTILAVIQLTDFIAWPLIFGFYRKYTFKRQILFWLQISTSVSVIRVSMEEHVQTKSMVIRVHVLQDGRVQTVIRVNHLIGLLIIFIVVISSSINIAITIWSSTSFLAGISHFCILKSNGEVGSS